MATPTVTASLTKSTYLAGEPMLLTVVYGDPDSQPVTVTVVLTAADGASTAPASVRASFDPVTLTVTDSSGRVWNRLSDDGSTARYLAVA